MARAALRWSRADLAAAAGVGHSTIVYFETDPDRATEAAIRAKLRAAFEARGVRFDWRRGESVTAPAA
jgi:hypothetical protein